ncbi:hypothetical protein BG015_000447 [Linnemannia schmuckeri]|uniref:polynucleotide adenylyltransferase n=1 Tax=Linnemannia schmuckeri TaxID=64567 RepID=A0A9P5S455_9FUNG|nr:hypothetical protein BG015_000447 [Linnemannia schmuckeri]
MVHTTTQPGTDDSFRPLLTQTHQQQEQKKEIESTPTPTYCDLAFSAYSDGELLPASLLTKTSAKVREASHPRDSVQSSDTQQQHYLEHSDSSNNEDGDDQDHTTVDQGLAFQARCQSLHRPDSPTSLEDSQSDSGLDSFAVDITDKERLMTRFPIDALPLSKLSTTNRNVPSAVIPIQQELLNGNSPMSPSQVATPPLSPIKATVYSKSDENDDDTLEDNDDESIENGIGKVARNHQDATLDESDSTSQEISETQENFEQALEEEQICVTDSGSEALLPSLQEETSSASLSADDTSVPAGASTSSTGNPPKVSAWSTLLPGVAPIPQPKPTTRPSAIQRSEQARLHERFPIVLPYESQVKLSMEMVDLFESLLPTEQSHERRTKFIKKIETILSVEWPGQDIQAYPFGSTVNDLGTSTSDVDICIMTTWSGLKNVQMLANAFRKHGMQKVFCVPRAKVPIVKLWDPELHLSCDVNINTPLGLLNTKMIKTYVAIDPRVRPFAMIIKHWARRRVLNDAANGGTISTYTWICIVINFLQMRSPPILPVLHKLPHTLSDDNQVINGNNTSFCDDIESLEGFGFPNKETLGGLLYAFFRRFAIEFDYDNHVISVREGCYLTKESKGWHLPGKQYKMFCVEEPIDTSRNLGNSSDMTSSKGLREEFRRALDILYKNASLNLCCAQFVFPPSYYHNNNNVRKGTNGTVITNNNNYAAGRRYLNGYRSQSYYYDEADDDDDDDDDSVGEMSVMETLNIGTRPAYSKDPTGSNKQHSGRRDSVSSSSRGQGGEKGGASLKESNNSNRQGENTSNRSQSKNRAKQTKNDKDSASSTAGDPSKPASSSRGKQEKSNSSSSTTANRRNKKASGGSAGDGQKGGRGSGGGNNISNGSAGGNSGRAPRAAVEFSLADIATAAPRLLSASSKTDQESLLTAVDNFVGSDPAGSTDGSKNRQKKRIGSKNVVWSTNSNRGESSRRQQPINKGAQLSADQDKTRVIIVASEDPSSNNNLDSSSNNNNATYGDAALST